MAQLRGLISPCGVAQDLERADVASAVAVFLLCDKDTPDPAGEDTRTMMSVLAVANYLRRVTTTSPHPCSPCITCVPVHTLVCKRLPC